MTQPFHLYLDSADLTALRQCLPHPVVWGVTTNPTLLKRVGVTWEALVTACDAPMRLLVASIRSRQAYLDLLALGVGSLTIPPALFAELMDHEATLAAERGFLADAAGLMDG